MTPTDTGPLLALIDRNEPLHALCTALLKTLPLPLLTTWPCMAEALHIAHREGGWHLQNRLWSLRTRGILRVHIGSDDETEQTQTLMAQYNNVPMDLADASLMAMLNALSLRRVFTLDSDFRVYRLAGGAAPEALP